MNALATKYDKYVVWSTINVWFQSRFILILNLRMIFGIETIVEWSLNQT